MDWTWVSAAHLVLAERRQEGGIVQDFTAVVHAHTHLPSCTHLQSHRISTTTTTTTISTTTTICTYYVHSDAYVCNCVPPVFSSAHSNTGERAVCGFLCIVDVALSQACAENILVALCQALAMTDCSCTLAHANNRPCTSCPVPSCR